MNIMLLFISTIMIIFGMILPSDIKKIEKSIINKTAINIAIGSITILSLILTITQPIINSIFTTVLITVTSISILIISINIIITHNNHSRDIITTKEHIIFLISGILITLGLNILFYVLTQMQINYMTNIILTLLIIILLSTITIKENPLKYDVIIKNLVSSILVTIILTLLGGFL
ncbi:MAG: hypothetical protein Q4Q23_06780 [Methanobacteriaceae archaeon]|nr:hypothetical protein [Methanobacteriaceae archaeon]